MTTTYEIKSLYTDSTIYGTWHEDTEMSVPKREMDTDKANSYIEQLLIPMGAKHYETSRAHFYNVDIDARHIKQYIFYK